MSGAEDRHLGELAAAVVDGELGHQPRERALAHLAHCAGCRSTVEGQRRLRAQLTALPDPGVPADLTARLLAVPAASRPPLAPPSLPVVVPAPAPRPGRVVGPRDPGRHTARARAAVLDAARDARPSWRQPGAVGPSAGAWSGRAAAVGGPRPSLRRQLAGGSIVALGITTALVLANVATRSQPSVDPAVDTLLVQYANTGDVPLTDSRLPAAVTLVYPR